MIRGLAAGLARVSGGGLDEVSSGHPGTERSDAPMSTVARTLEHGTLDLSRSPADLNLPVAPYRPRRPVDPHGSIGHGRRMPFEDFVRCDIEDGHLYELARGVVVVTHVAGIHHGMIVWRHVERDRFLRSRSPRVHQTSWATAGDCRIRLPRMSSDRHPDLAVYPNAPPDEGAKLLDPMVLRPRRRGRLRGRRGARLRREARGIPPRRRPRVLDPEPQHPYPARPGQRRRRHLAGAHRRRRRPVSLPAPARGWNCGPATCSASPEINGRPPTCLTRADRRG